MKIAGTPPEIVYAYTKTGRLLSSTFMDNYPPEIVAEWDAALEDYFKLEGKREHSDAHPSPADNQDAEIPQSDLPALKDMPFTDAEKRLVLDCLEAIDGTIAQPTSLRMKLELAAALLMHACAAAYERYHGRQYHETKTKPHSFLMRRERNIGSDVLHPTVRKPEHDLNALERAATVRIFWKKPVKTWRYRHQRPVILVREAGTK